MKNTLRRKKMINYVRKVIMKMPFVFSISELDRFCIIMMMFIATMNIKAYGSLDKCIYFASIKRHKEILESLWLLCMKKKNKK